MHMLISKNLMLSVIFFVAIVFGAVLIYTLSKAFMSNKKMRDAEKANELLFMAKMQAQRLTEANRDKEKMESALEFYSSGKLSDYAQRPLSNIKETPIVPPMDEDVPVIPTEPISNKRLSDFFEA